MTRERDKERLESKRKQDQLKKLFDEEKDENKKKLMEVYSKLLNFIIILIIKIFINNFILVTM